MTHQQDAWPTTVVIFGASGDLTQRKLVPALYNLHRDQLLPNTYLVGFARSAKSNEQFREEMHDAIHEHSREKPTSDEEWQEVANGFFYHAADYNDSLAYSALRSHLDNLDEMRGIPSGQGNRLFYLSTPPDVYPTIISRLGEAGLNHTHRSEKPDQGWTRLIIEKPFGHDLDSARELNNLLLSVFDETQVYRIDRYLGKETVQNILTFRLGNSIFEPLWNRRYVDHVQILVSESIGVEGRGSYYDHSGAMRDIVQNHMLQLLALVAMEPPATFAADAVRNEKVKALQAIRPVVNDDITKFTVRGQYTDYRTEKGVAPQSTTETYVALKLMIDNWRWAGVPFYLRTGKCMPQRLTEIAIQFRQPPLMLFSKSGQHPRTASTQPNLLVLRIQPEEGILLQVGLKPPGSSMRLKPVNLDFLYNEGFGIEAPEAYERLILDAILGDATLFIRRDEVEAAWSLVTPILEGWEAGLVPKPAPYWAGTWGPDAAEALIAADGRNWREP